MRLMDEPLVVRVVAGACALAMWLLWALMWPGVAQAAEPTRCGEHATGMRADGSVWTGASPRMWVGRDGYWHICQPWVPEGGDPEMPPPAEVVRCPAGVAIERWGTRPECMAPRMLPSLQIGQVIVLIDDTGGTRGMAAYRCTPAGWRLEGSHCTWLYPPAQPSTPASRPLAGDARTGAASWPRR